MTLELITFLMLGAAAGGFVNGFAGTGTALFALGFYLVVLPPQSAVAVVALMAVLAGLQGLWEVRAHIPSQTSRIARLTVPGLLGVPLGLLLLGVLDAAVLRIGVAVLLVVYGGYFGLRATLPALARPYRGVDAGIGFAGGVLGGAAGLSGALPTLWLSLRGWSKLETRAVLQSFNMAVLMTTIAGLVLSGAYSWRVMAALVIVIPTGLGAAQLGIVMFRRLSDAGFRRVLILMCLAMGLGVALGELV